MAAQGISSTGGPPEFGSFPFTIVTHLLPAPEVLMFARLVGVQKLGQPVDRPTVLPQITPRAMVTELQ
jgi:hypothetical protein